MFAKTIKYRDLDGNSVEDTFYFHMSKVEIAKMAMIQGDDFEERIRRIIVTNNGQQIMDLFEGMIRDTVGVRSEDGKSFIKSPEITNAFMGSDAYDIFFLEVVTDADKAAEFIAKVAPKDMHEKVQAGLKERGIIGEKVQPIVDGLTNDAEVQAAKAQPDAPKDTTPAWVTEGRVPSDDELKGASNDLIVLAFQRRMAAKTPPAAT